MKTETPFQRYRLEAHSGYCIVAAIFVILRTWFVAVISACLLYTKPASRSRHVNFSVMYISRNLCMETGYCRVWRSTVSSNGNEHHCDRFGTMFGTLGLIGVVSGWPTTNHLSTSVSFNIMIIQPLFRFCRGDNNALDE
jgi:hypothetical protein